MAFNACLLNYGTVFHSKTVVHIFLVLVKWKFFSYSLDLVKSKKEC